MPSGRRRKRRGNRSKRKFRNNNRFWERVNRANPIQTRTIRYITDVTSNDDFFTGRCLMNTVIAVGTASGTKAVILQGAVRLRQIKLAFLSTVGFGTDTTDLQLRWIGERGPEVVYTSRGTSFMPAHIVSRPPKGSLASMWTSVGDVDLDEVLFRVQGPQYAIMDVTYQYILADGTDTSTVTVASSSIGVYYTPLDSAASSSTIGNGNWKPDGLAFKAYTAIPAPTAIKERKRLALDAFADTLIGDHDSI